MVIATIALGTGCLASPEEVQAIEAEQAAPPSSPPATGRGCDRETASLIQYYKRRYWELMSRGNPFQRQTDLCYEQHRRCAKNQADACDVRCCDRAFDLCMESRQFFVDFDGRTACGYSIAIHNLYYTRCVNQPEQRICGDHAITYAGQTYRCSGFLEPSCQ